MKLRDTYLLVWALLLSVIAIACGSSTNTATPVARIAGDKGSAASLTGTTWTLKSYGAADASKNVLAGTEITLKFDATTGQAGGSSGCNDYSAPFTVAKDVLTLGTIVSTKKACTTPEGVMTQENDYLTLLAAVKSFMVAKDSLQLVTGDGRELLFTAKK